MAERQAHSGGLMMPLLAGLAGAGLALLLAPRSGQETREQLKARADNLQQQAKEKAAVAKTQATTTVEQAKGMKNRVKSAIKNEADTDTDPVLSEKNNEEV